MITKITPILLSKGFRNTSINFLTKEMKISKKTFYHHFQSKKEMIRFIMPEIHRLVDKTWEDIEVESYNAIECILVTMEKLDNAYGFYQQYINIHELSDYYDHVRNEIINTYTEIAKKFCIRMMILLKRDGYLLDGLNIDLCAFTFSKTYTNFLVNTKFYPEFSYSKVLQNWFYLFLRSLLNGEGVKVLENKIGFKN